MKKFAEGPGQNQEEIGMFIWFFMQKGIAPLKCYRLIFRVTVLQSCWVTIDQSFVF